MCCSADRYKAVINIDTIQSVGIIENKNSIITRE